MGLLQLVGLFCLVKNAVHFPHIPLEFPKNWQKELTARVFIGSRFSSFPSL
jgi:uncharacterized membrane protein